MSKNSDYRTPEWLLEQWGIWARISESPRTDYPNMSPYHRPVAKSGEGCHITDDDGVLIDSILSELAEDSKAQQDVLYLYYKCGWSIRGIHKKTGQSVSQVHGLLDSGKSWFKGRVRGVRTLAKN